MGSLAIRCDTFMVDGPYRRDLYVFSGITKLHIDAEDGAELKPEQLVVQTTGGAVQKYRGVLKHVGGLVVSYVRDGIKHYQPIVQGDEYVIYSPSVVINDPDRPSPISYVLGATDRYIKPNGQIECTNSDRSAGFIGQTSTPSNSYRSGGCHSTQQADSRCR